MAKKLDTTPDGIRCTKCGQDYPPYYFFSPRGKYNKAFFASGVPLSHVCWYCAAPYRCVQCHEIKPASEFRVQGRICRDCKNIEPDFLTRVTDAILDTFTIDDSGGGEITPENGGDE